MSKLARKYLRSLTGLNCNATDRKVYYFTEEDVVSLLDKFPKDESFSGASLNIEIAVEVITMRYEEDFQRSYIIGVISERYPTLNLKTFSVRDEIELIERSKDLLLQEGIYAKEYFNLYDKIIIRHD